MQGVGRSQSSGFALALFVQTAFVLTATATACALSLTAALRALDIVAGRVAFLARWRSLAPGALVGTAAWAQGLDAATLAEPVGVDPASALAALAASITGAALAFAVFRRCKGPLRAIAAGAVLGAAIAACQALLLVSIGADVDLGGVWLPSGMALASALAVAAFAILGRWRRTRGRLASGLCLLAGLAVSTALDFAAPQFAGPSPAAAATLAQLAPIATQVLAVLLTASYALERGRAVRRATTARAARGSPPPVPARRPVGTAWLRPRRGRSAAVPAAALARRDRTAR
jgi:NO-binding membrane sensor protein with MHYT domain